MVERRGGDDKTAAKATVDSMLTSPPKNAQQLYAALLDEVRVIRKELGLLDKEFYEDASSLEFVSRWMPVVREAMRCHNLAELNSLRQIQSVIFLSRDPDVKEMYPGLTPVGPDTCAQLCQLQNKLLAFMPGRFTLVMDKLGRVHSLCEKYLLSFHSSDSPYQIDTAQKYMLSRRTWANQAAERAKAVLYNSHLFLHESLSVSRLARGATDLLRRADASSAPFLGLFADACENLRASLDSLVDWISSDRNYPVRLKIDLSTLDKNRVELEKLAKAQRHQLHMAQYRSKSLQSEKAKLHVELQAMADREAELLFEEEQLQQDLGNAKLDLEIKEFRKEELRREVKESTSASNAAAMDAELSSLTEQLRRLRSDMPQMERKLVSLRSKLVVIEEKQKRFAEVTTALNDTEALMTKLRAEVSDAGAQLQKAEQTLERCAEIYRLKMSAETPERIFFGLPLDGLEKEQQKSTQQQQSMNANGGKSQSAPGSGPSQLSSRGGEIPSATPFGHHANASSTASTVGDKRMRRSETAEINAGSAFDQVCLLVAHKIERDWKRLYRALPFVPQRSRETIDRDIAELQRSFVADSLFECAWRAIQRWRRYHRRAKLLELRSALERMRRGDVVDDIDAFLRPPDGEPRSAKDDKHNDPLPEHLDKQLMAFYRHLEPADSQQHDVVN